MNIFVVIKLDNYKNIKNSPRKGLIENYSIKMSLKVIFLLKFCLSQIPTFLRFESFFKAVKSMFSRVKNCLTYVFVKIWEGSLFNYS